ncbi:MAG: hypothetical protein DCC75_10535 [Proteobacteria bacterium]|nr:MAG: hypothetical protein DCC75_10535 [Pseudomonadota bacterium]
MLAVKPSAGHTPPTFQPAQAALQALDFCRIQFGESTGLIVHTLVGAQFDRTNLAIRRWPDNSIEVMKIDDLSRILSQFRYDGHHDPSTFSEELAKAIDMVPKAASSATIREHRVSKLQFFPDGRIDLQNHPIYVSSAFCLAASEREALFKCLVPKVGDCQEQPPNGHSYIKRESNDSILVSAHRDHGGPEIPFYSTFQVQFSPDGLPIPKARDLTAKELRIKDLVPIFR